MNPKEIIEQCTENGLTLSITDDGNLDVVGSQDWIDIWGPILRENKAAILAELEPLQDLHPCKPCTPLETCNVTETLPQQPSNTCSTPVPDAPAMRTHSDGKYSVTVTDANSDPVLAEVTIRGQASFTLEIPKAYYDGLALLELLEQHNAQAAETQGIDSRRAA